MGGSTRHSLVGLRTAWTKVTWLGSGSVLSARTCCQARKIYVQHKIVEVGKQQQQPASYGHLLWIWVGVNATELPRNSFWWGLRPKHQNFKTSCEAGEAVHQCMLKQDGHFYVCGSARQVPEDIYTAMKEVMMANERVNEDEAEAILSNLKMEGRNLVLELMMFMAFYGNRSLIFNQSNQCLGWTGAWFKISTRGSS